MKSSDFVVLSRLLVVVSMLLFIAAVLSVMVPVYGLYLALALIAVGSMTMMTSASITESDRRPTKIRPASVNEFFEEPDKESVGL